MFVNNLLFMSTLFYVYRLFSVLRRFYRLSAFPTFFSIYRRSGRLKPATLRGPETLVSLAYFIGYTPKVYGEPEVPFPPVTLIPDFRVNTGRRPYELLSA